MANLTVLAVGQRQRRALEIDADFDARDAR